MRRNSDVIIGKTYQILSLKNTALKQRVELYARGIFPGKSVHIQHISPLGDPLIVLIDEQLLAMSRKMLAGFELRECTE